MHILITGGTGYIGSHTAVELIKSGHSVTIVDNLSNSDEGIIERLKTITGSSIPFHKIDLCDKAKTNQLFLDNSFDAVIHFAGLKAVGESVEQALYYYQNNLESTLNLLDAMKRSHVKKLVFSSSATVYGDPEQLPITESAPLRATNPYGQTKLIIEQILMDLAATHDGWSSTSLRYFNPIGAHESGLIGENPRGIPNNLTPYIVQVAAGKLDKVMVFGDDYNTPDGTGIRDYIHVVDLAKAHIAALEHLDHPDVYKAYNIGSGTATSVLEMIKAFEVASNKQIPYEIVARRPGDIAACYADPSLANGELEWSTQLSIQDGCDSAWNFSQR